MSASSWRWLRRASQLTFLVLACVAVVRTTYPLGDPRFLNVIPELSPLLAATAMLAARAFIPELLFWSLLVVGLTLAFGRAFCGWACPVGTTLDAADAVIGRFRRRRPREGAQPRHRRYRFLFLAALGVLAAFGLPLAGWFDPLSVFPRTLATAAVPYATFALDGATRLMYRAPALAGAAAALRQHLIPENMALIPGHWVVAAFFVALVLLGLFRRRFYCRYVCPSGALLALLGWASPFGRRVDAESCTSCRRCRDVCRMGAIGGDGRSTAQAECNLCLDCLGARGCGATTSFGFGRARREDNPTSWGPGVKRRDFIAAAGAGLVAAAPLALLGRRVERDPYLIRPPGSLAEDDFQARCIRCGECVRVCLTQGLAPVHFEAGPTGLWTPRLIPRKGYCEYRCTMCTQICPSGAIAKLDEARKKRTVIGVAVIDTRRCIPWVSADTCNVCEEMCPTAPKAIVARGRGRAKPYVVLERCVGCGICEYACPVAGRSAIRVLGNHMRDAVASSVGGGAGRRRRRGRRG